MMFDQHHRYPKYGRRISKYLQYISQAILKRTKNVIEINFIYIISAMHIPTAYTIDSRNDCPTKPIEFIQIHYFPNITMKSNKPMHIIYKVSVFLKLAV